MFPVPVQLKPSFYKLFPFLLKDFTGVFGVIKSRDLICISPSVKNNDFRRWIWLLRVYVVMNKASEGRPPPNFFEDNNWGRQHSRKPYFVRRQEIDYIKSLWSFIFQYDSNVRECAETNYDSNGLLLWISNIALSTRLGRKMGENEKLWITHRIISTLRLLSTATAMSQCSSSFPFLKAFFWLVQNALVEKRAKKVCDTWLGWRHIWHSEVWNRSEYLLNEK